MKKSLLEIVREILSDMDSDDVGSISDTVEAQQVASIVERTFWNFLTTRDIPEHTQLLKFTAASDSNFPTHFRYPDNIRRVEQAWYKNSDGDYRKVNYVAPLEFLMRTDGIESDYVEVTDKSGGTTLKIRTNAQPYFWTSFDDDWIVFNAYESTVDTTLQASKVRVFGTLYPVFEKTDTHTMDIDETVFPYLIAEAKSASMSLLKGSVDPKVEQAAKRQKNHIQNDMYKVTQPTKWSNYGRT